MKKLILVASLFFLSVTSFATHIAGGELYYEYIGPGAAANTAKYKLTMRLFKECSSSSGVSLPTEKVIVAAYNNPGLSYFSKVSLTYYAPPANLNPFQNTPGAIPCLTGNTSSCYYIGLYTGEIELPITTTGYTLVWTRYTRMANIANIPGVNLGATFTNQIPGSLVLPNANNSSPQFLLKDTIIVCKQLPISLDYGALDPDGDSLSYKFVTAYDGYGGSSGLPDPFNTNGPPATFQLVPLSYNAPFSATSPLGSTVTINAQSGLISGTAPAMPGKYVVCVAIEEWRNEQKINEHRKDFILTVADCSLNQANIGPDDRTCNGFSFSFINNAQGQFTNYLWSFGDGSTATSATINHTYTDTGKYLVKLIGTITGGCKDSATKYVYVYPGFTSAIKVVGSCVQYPVQFFDSTKTNYGVVDSWSWNFGDLSTIADTAHSKDTAWLYPSAGNYMVQLISTNTKGCIDTTLKTISVLDKPLINLPFIDTLICSVDTLTLFVNTIGAIQWTPNYNIINANTTSPMVYPKQTTTYIVAVNENGCINSDSIVVYVVDTFSIHLGLDTTICKMDTIVLNPISTALYYNWISSTGVPIAPVKNPLVHPLVNTTYYVDATIGKCSDKDTIQVKVVPYPMASITDVNPICFGSKVQLNANIVGSNFYWSPTTSLLNANTLQPIAGPSKTTTYILTVTDTLGCPKPFKDTINVVVIPIIGVFSGHDTAIVINQPLQLNATTNAVLGSKFKWTPSIGLSTDTMFNPIAILNISNDFIKYKVRVTTPEGCYGEDDIIVRLFRTNPDIFVPTAFTPNGDRKNDILKPICVGITKLDFFRVYNRWGQLVYETSTFDTGWDGKFADKEQASGTYVFMAQGEDYTGKIIFKKGTAVLIR